MQARAGCFGGRIVDASPEQGSCCDVGEEGESSSVDGRRGVVLFEADGREGEEVERPGSCSLIRWCRLEMGTEPAVGPLHCMDCGLGGELVAGFHELVTEFGRGEGRAAVAGESLEVSIELVGERYGRDEGVEGGIGRLFEEESVCGGEQVGAIDA
jgi:hypothetical protein